VASVTSASAAQQHDQRADELEQSHAGELAHHFDIARQARHQLTCLRTVMIAEAEALDLVEQVIAHVEGNVLGGFLRPEALREIEHPAHGCHANQRQRAPDDGLHVTGLNAVVNDTAHNLREYQVSGGHKQQADDGAQRNQPVGPQVFECTRQRMHGSLP